MEATEKHIKFTSAHIEVNQDYDINDRVIFQGEGEVTKQEMRSVGKDGEFTRVTHIMPLVVTFQQSEGVYKAPDVGSTAKKSKSKQLRDIMFIQWSQQLQTKYPEFEIYYNAAMDKLIETVRQKIV